MRFHMVAVLGTGMSSSVASVDPELTANPLRFCSSAAGSNATCTDDDAHRRCNTYASGCCERQDGHGLDRIKPRTMGGSAGGIANGGAAAGSTFSAGRGTSSSRCGASMSDSADVLRTCAAAQAGASPPHRMGAADVIGTCAAAQAGAGPLIILMRSPVVTPRGGVDNVVGLPAGSLRGFDQTTGAATAAAQAAATGLAAAHAAVELSYRELFKS